MLSNWETAVLFYLDPTCSIQVSQFITLDPSPLVRQTSEALQCSMLELILMLECHALRLANLRKQGASLENEVWAEPGVPILAPDVVRETLYENAQGSGSRSRKRKRQGDEAQDPTECGDHSFSSSDSATSVNLVSPNRQTRAEQKAHACLQLDTSDLCAEDKAVLGLENNLIPLRLVVEGSDVLLAGPALPTNPWRLKLGERIGHGRLGVAYRATLSTDQETCDIVAKVINLNGAHIKPDEDGDIRVYPTVAHVSVAAKVEAHAYATLADVQGRLVPEYYGLFSTDNETTFVALMSPGGKDVDALHVSMM
jgi:hypothetical protein